jgi:hypothetical protein
MTGSRRHLPELKGNNRKKWMQEVAEALQVKGRFLMCPEVL